MPGKPIVRPIQHSIKMVYAAYAEKLLKENPTWWGRWDKSLKRSNCYLYCQENKRIVLKMSWQIWKNVVESFYFAATESLIEGETLNLGSNLGKIRIARIERDFSKPVVDWPETFKRKLIAKDGRYVRIYCTTPDYCKIKWTKGKGIPNQSCYVFTPAKANPATGKGFKGNLFKALTKNPQLKYKYKFYPVLSKYKIAQYAASVRESQKSGG